MKDPLFSSNNKELYANNKIMTGAMFSGMPHNPNRSGYLIHLIKARRAGYKREEIKELKGREKRKETDWKEPGPEAHATCRKVGLELHI